MKGKHFIAIIGAVTVINLLSRLIGYFREMLVGFQFGFSFQADSIVTAYTIPNFLYIVLGGALTSAFVSVYSKIEDHEQKKQYLKNIFGWLTVVLVVLSLFFVFFSDNIIPFIFRDAPETIDLSIQLFTIMAPATLFLILSMWLQGLLNVNDRFSIAAFSTLIMNGSFVLIAFVFYPMIGSYSHAYGALISSFFMFLFLVIYNLRKGFFDFKPSLGRSPEVFRTFRLTFHIMLGGAALQLYFLIYRIFGAHLYEGTIMALNLTSKFVQLPQTVLMMAVTAVIFPMLARRVAANKHDSVAQIHGKGLRLLALAILPASVYIVLYAEEILITFFEYQDFTRENTITATPLLQIFVIGMFFHAANFYITRFYYAYERSIYPLIVSLMCVLGLNITLSVLLIGPFGAEGLAWAMTISASINFLLLLAGIGHVLKWQKKTLEQWKSILLTVIKLFLLIFIMTLTIYGFKSLYTFDLPLVSLIVGGLLSVFLYILILYLLRFNERKELKQLLQRKVGDDR
ncbi:murein biosynthesis integral membrane protein MurJ [Geomicrobium sp. JSM 1781026]|uniref:murein biosynthesis integral membrane protein MurJ n=1 Tax=Geomicrobium sp. JSM 1781026 TaxID=3344580 RepID=UPI0035C1C2AD